MHKTNKQNTAVFFTHFIHACQGSKCTVLQNFILCDKVYHKQEVPIHNKFTSERISVYLDKHNRVSLNTKTLTLWIKIDHVLL